MLNMKPQLSGGSPGMGNLSPRTVRK